MRYLRVIDYFFKIINDKKVFYENNEIIILPNESKWECTNIFEKFENFNYYNEWFYFNFWLLGFNNWLFNLLNLI